MLVEFSDIERARSGDDAAFGRLVSAYRKRVLGTIARLISQPDDVEDVGQEVFVRVYYSLGRLRTPEVFEPWLYRMTVNAAYDYLRKRKRRAERRMSDLTEQQMTSADAAAGMLQDGVDRHRTGVRERLDELLAGVSEEDRILLILKEVEGLSLKELEAVYRVNGNALKVRLFRARQRALKAFAARENEGEGSPEPKRKAAV